MFPEHMSILHSVFLTTSIASCYEASQRYRAYNLECLEFTKEGQLCLILHGHILYLQI